MNENDKKIAACVDQIISDIDRLAEIVRSGEFDTDAIEDYVIEMDNRLTQFKHQLTIEVGGLELTQYPKPLASGFSRPIICIETGKVYDSVSQASKDMGINAGNISQVVRGIFQAAEGYHFEEYHNPVKTTRGKTVAVRCVETGKVYRSIIEAARDVGIERSRISNVIHGRYKTAGGYHWERYEEPPDEPDETDIELIDWIK